jgi:hypothetical protein
MKSQDFKTVSLLNQITEALKGAGDGHSRSQISFQFLSFLSSEESANKN